MTLNEILDSTVDNLQIYYVVSLTSVNIVEDLDKGLKYELYVVRNYAIALK